MALVRADKKSSSSHNTAPSRCSYHVFLSFRGEDTRKTFTDHLYTALVNAGFRAFRDDDELERGQDIKPELEKAIQQSRSSVIVFSKDYASSRWCLDELVMILERKRTSDHVVFPVFYDVDPSHVRKQTGSLAKAFARHQKKQSLDKLNRWRAALAQVADLAGMVLQNQVDGHESKFINKIVNVIQDKLRRVPLSLAPHLIGIHSKVQKINLWLEDGSSDVCILGICGIGGVGKTTLAKVVYNSNFRRFEASSFLENIREISENPNGLVQLQRQFLSDILNGIKVKVCSVSQGKSKIEDVISSKKVLLVLDDLNHKDQFDAILEMKGSFCSGSKIIVTTRDAGLLRASQVDKVQYVETLDDDKSLELFSRHAFRQVHPIESYMELTKKVVSHCEGLPLALRTLGSSLSGQSLDVWESASKKLEVIPNGEIVKKLRISYDSLQDDHDQNLFLHIACFFIGKEKDVIVKILDGCDFYTIVGIQNLIDSCLVTIDKDNMVKMHQMIRDMGREIVRLEAKEPEKRSRLWHHKDSFNVLTEKNGSETIEGLALNMHYHNAGTPLRNSDKEVLETNGFTRMKKLILLQLSHVQLNGSFEEFPKGLRWLYWFEFPLGSVPFEFPMDNLVVLEMQYSSLRQFWKGTKYLPSLKIIDVSHSHDLTETGDFSSVPNLERLILKDCASLLEVHESIGNLGKLIYLDMEDCKEIRKFPNNIAMLKLLETLIISGCSNLNELPIDIISRMESLKVFKANEIPKNRWVTTTQEVKSWARRSLGNCLAFFPSTLVELSLGNCNLSDDIFPRDFGNLLSLQKLDLCGNPICSLPDCVRGLRRLQYLDFSHCTSLKSLVGLPRVSQLYMNMCPSLEKVAFQSISCLPVQVGLYLETDKHVPSKLIEIEYWFKLEPIGNVDAEIINLLSLCNLESLTLIRMETINGTISGRPLDSIQGLSDYGIFSTFVMGNENKVPGRFEHRSKASLPICFTVPLLPNSRIRGLNIFSIYGLTTLGSRLEGTPVLTVINNKSKDLKWIYVPSCWGIPSKGEDVIWLSHWNFGNQLEAGDQVSVSVLACHPAIQVREWGFQVVHEPVEKMFSQHNTDLNVMGGDLSELYQVIPGTYVLYGGPFREGWFNSKGIIADADADADGKTVITRETLDTYWKRLFGDAFDTDAGKIDWQRFRRYGLIADADADAEADNEYWQQSEGALAGLGPPGNGGSTVHHGGGVASGADFVRGVLNIVGGAGCGDRGGCGGGGAGSSAC